MAAVGVQRRRFVAKAHTGHRNRTVTRQSIVLPRQQSGGLLQAEKSPDLSVEASLCSRYLFSRPVTRQLSSAYMCLTSVFGMGTGGPTRQSTRTMYGDPWENRTPVTGVRGRCLNRLTNGPLVHLQGLEPGTH